MNFEGFSFFPENFLADGGVRVERDTGKKVNFFLASLEFHSIFVGVMVKEEITAAKENSTIISSKWRPHLYWKGKGRKRTSFRRNSYISTVRSLEL